MTPSEGAHAPTSGAPVGVFDSGVGGLSVLREIRRELPAEDLIYVADSAHGPYGDRNAAYVLERSERMMDFLVSRGAKAVVIACNTATGSAVDPLRDRYPLPIVGMEPAVKPAVAATRSGVVGVLATSQTVSAPRFAALLARHSGAVRVLPQPCSGLVQRVEVGDVDGPETKALVAKYVEPLVQAGADTLVIGCTHYAFLEDVIQEVAGVGVRVIDSGVPVARQLRRRLEALGLLADAGSAVGPTRFWTTGSPSSVADLISRLWGTRIEVDAVPAAPVP